MKKSQGLQLIMIFLDFVIPPAYFIDCDIFLNILWMLHPCLNFTTLYVMIFIRQFFTFRALRETRLREFISGILMVVSLTVGCIFGSIILVVCGMLYLYPSQFSSPSDTTTECLTDSTVSKRKLFLIFHIKYDFSFSYHKHYWFRKSWYCPVLLLLDGIPYLQIPKVNLYKTVRFNQNHR